MAAESNIIAAVGHEPRPGGGREAKAGPASNNPCPRLGPETPDGGVAATDDGLKRARADRDPLAGILQSAQHAIIGESPVGLVTFWNRGAEQLYGYAAAEILGRPIGVLCPPERAAEAALLNARVRGGEELADHETERLTKAGARIWVALALAPVRDNAGRVAGVSTIAHDIGRQRAAAQALRLSEERYRSLVTATAQIVWTAGADGKVSQDLPSWRAFTGQTCEEVQGDGWAAALHPEDRRRALITWARAVRQRAPYDVEYRVRRHDGDYRQMSARGVPLLDDGVVREWVGTCIDITDRRRAEQDLQYANIIVEQSPVVLFRALAAKGFPRVYVSHNIARFGYTAEEATGGAFPFPDYVHPDDRPAAIAALSRLLRGETEIFELDYRAVIRDGSIRWIHDRTVPLRDDSGRIFAYQGTLIDITERKQTERALQRVNRALRTLSRGNEVLVRAASEAELQHEMCRVIVESGGYRMAWIGEARGDSEKTVAPVAWAGAEAGYLARTRFTWADEPAGQGPSGRAIRTGEPQTSQNLASDPIMSPWHGEALKRGFASTAALPLINGSGRFGVLVIYAGEPDAFDAGELKLLRELATDLAYGLQALRDRSERAAAVQRWQASLEATIGAIASTIEMRDPYTAGHQQRVAQLAVAIARERRLSEHDVQGIYLAGIIHDVGKISVPAEILSKPGKLSKVEYQLIQGHAQAGYDILKGVDFPWPIAEAVLQHHERLDGSGYPNGLAAGAIRPESKILAVADVVEAMTSRRPYRETLGVEAALAEIEQGKATRYDAAAVDACIALFRHKGFAFK